MDSVIKLNVANVISIALIAVIGLFVVKWGLTAVGQPQWASYF
jgi:hypothetical protein